LGLNAALGPTDLANLPWTAIDFKSGWLNYPRPKTAVSRRIPLWPETLRELKAWRSIRPAPAAPVDDALVFVTVNGRKFVREVESKKSPGSLTCIDCVSAEFAKLRVKCEIERPNLGFYKFRHLAANVGKKTGDSDAVRAIMGHAVDSSDTLNANYTIEFDDDARLLRVTNYVRDWLFGKRSAK
jgi:integrase